MIALLLAATLAAPPAPRMGDDVTIGVPTAGTVVAVAGTARIASEVEGDVVALAGDVELLPGSRVRGDVVALGGIVRGSGTVEGRSVALAPLGLRVTQPTGTARLDIGFALLRIGGWMVLASLLAALAPGFVRRCASELRQSPVLTLLVGVLAIGTWLAVAVLALASSGTPAGVALLLLWSASFLALKVVGIAALADQLARRVTPILPVALRGRVPATGLVAGVLAGAALLPFAGGAIWLLANLAGVGAVASAVIRPKPVLIALSGLAAR